MREARLEKNIKPSAKNRCGKISSIYLKCFVTVWLIDVKSMMVIDMEKNFSMRRLVVI